MLKQPPPLSFEALNALLVEHLPRFKHYVLGHRDRPLVPVIGCSGTGKSTLINALLGAPLRSKYIGGLLRVICDRTDDTRFPEIGHNFETATLSPGLYSVDGFDWLIGDFAGFEDARGPEYKVFASITTEMAFRSCQLLKALVVVIDFSEFLVNRAAGFKTLADILDRLFVDIDAIGPSIIFAITKCPFDYPRDQLRAMIEKSLNVGMDPFLESVHGGEHQALADFVTDSIREQNETEMTKGRLRVARLLKEAMDEGRVCVVDVVGPRAPNDLTHLKNKIEQLTATAKLSALKFNRYDHDRVQFESYIIEQMDQGLQMLSEYDQKTCDLTEHTQAKSKIISFINNIKQLLEQSKQEEHSQIHLLAGYQDQIQKLDEEKQHILTRKEKWLDDLTCLKSKLSDLKASGHEKVIIWKDSIHEKRQRFVNLNMGYFWFGYTTKMFEYSNPKRKYIEAELKQENGRWLKEERYKDVGYFSIEYQSDRLMDGIASVTLWGDKSSTNNYQAKEKNLRRAIERAKVEVSKYKSQEEAINRQLEDFNEKIKQNSKEDLIQTLLNQKQASEDRLHTIQSELDQLNISLRGLRQAIAVRKALFDTICFMTEYLLFDDLAMVVDFKNCWTQHLLKGQTSVDLSALRVLPSNHVAQSYVPVSVVDTSVMPSPLPVEVITDSKKLRHAIMSEEDAIASLKRKMQPLQDKLHQHQQRLSTLKGQMSFFSRSLPPNDDQAEQMDRRFTSLPESLIVRGS